MKGVPLSLTPLFVQRDDQGEGLIHLLRLALRFLTLIEYRVRRRLQESGSQLVGLHRENPKKGTCRPTTERLLQAFEPITLTIVPLPEGAIGHVTPLTSLQVQILELLDLSPDIYTSLAELSDSRAFCKSLESHIYEYEQRAMNTRNPDFCKRLSRHKFREW